MMKIISLFFYAAFSTSAYAAPGMDLSAGGSPEFFKGFPAVSKAGAEDSRIRQAIGQGKKDPNLGYARLDLHAPVPALDKKDWPNYFSFGLSIDGAGSMGSRDAALSLSTARIFAGMFRGTFEGALFPDLFLTSSLLLGAGSEKQQEFVDGGSAIALASRSAVDLITGVDAQLMKVWRFRKSTLRFTNTLQTQETFFRAVSSKAEGTNNVSWDLPSASHDWLLRNDLLVSRYNVHLILGKHPYPTALLPRVWNRVSQVPSGLKPLFSLGGGITANVGGRTEGALLAGYYAGKIGGEIRINSPDEINVRISSYGIPSPMGAKSQTQRAYGLALDIAL